MWILTKLQVLFSSHLRIDLGAKIIYTFIIRRSSPISNHLQGGNDIKKSIALTLVALCILFSFSACATKKASTSFYNESHAYQMDADSKNAFAEETDSKFDAGSHKELSDEEMNKLLEQLVFSGEDNADAVNVLAEHGIYWYAAVPQNIPLAECEDAVLMDPYILYSPADQTWIVCFGGNWVNDNWKNMDSGGKDEYGIRYTNTSSSLCLEDSYFMITDQNNSEIIETTYRSDASFTYAECFMLEDEVNGIFNKTYVGYRWFGYCVYNASFADCNATVMGYYIHNYTE